MLRTLRNSLLTSYVPSLEKRGLPIGPLDNLIAGVALAHRATLVTRNTREFSRVPNLAILDWYD